MPGRLEIGGIEALLENRKWSCPQKEVETLLNHVTSSIIHNPTSPDPDYFILQYCSAILGGRGFYTTPEWLLDQDEQDELRPNLIF